MKQLLGFLLSLLFFNQIYADCDNTGSFWVYPSNNKLNTNSLIVLNAYAGMQEVVTNLNDKYPIYLESENHRVLLEVIETHKGFLDIAQCLLSPKDSLLVGETYTLKIDSIDPFAEYLLSNWNEQTKKREPFTWIVSNSVDNNNPILTEEPKIVDKRYIEYGCGPEIFVDFEMKIEDDSDILVETELIDIDSNKRRVYYLILRDKMCLSVGHGMCSGAFELSNTGFSKIRFKFLDICGNTTNEWTGWVKFENSFAEDVQWIEE